MRVGMRRLRTAITGFAPALALPKAAQEKKVGKVAKILGRLRDLDVMQESLETQYLPELPQEEQNLVKKALKKLDKKRKKVSKKVQKTLMDSKYQKLQQGFEQWLAEPEYNAIASAEIQQVLPDLLLPQLSAFFLHPGWLVGVRHNLQDGFILDHADPPTVYQILAQQSEVIHDLRKEAKRTRYQMELFTDFYGQDYNSYVKDIKKLQTLLGDIQDSFVLKDTLNHLLHLDFKKELPVFFQKLQEIRFQKWQKWQPLQEKFIDATHQNKLRLILVQGSPVPEDHSETNNQTNDQTEDPENNIEHTYN